MTVAEARNNAGGEEGVAVSWHDEPKVHESSHDDYHKSASHDLASHNDKSLTLVVLEDVAHILERDRPVQRCFPLVDLEALLDKLLLPCAKELRVFGEVRDDEEERDGHDAGEQALDDEDPAPRLVAAQAGHVAQSGGEQAAEGASEGGGGEEKAETLLGLVTLVPHAWGGVFQ